MNHDDMHFHFSTLTFATNKHDSDFTIFFFVAITLEQKQQKYRVMTKSNKICNGIKNFEKTTMVFHQH